MKFTVMKMKTSRIPTLAPARLGACLAATLTLAGTALLAEDCPPHWLGHDRTRPLPPVVDPGQPSREDQVGKAPSDAVVLFDGTDVSKWVAMDGKPTKWRIHDGALECVPGSGYARTLQCFGECQLHVEFATPNPPHGSSQGRGNSGVFFGMGRYEIQVLDSYNNKTYADGSCGSVYNQYPPLVNASRPPGQWQTYDILWTPPKFDADGKLLSAAHVTVLHNGVLIQNNVKLIGQTDWLVRAPYHAHPEKLPIALQDHGNPVRYRNLWVRELDGGKPEFYLPDSVLDSYCGNYDNCQVSRRDGNLLVHFGGQEFVMFAQSPTHFFSKVVDVQAEFDPQGAIRVSVGEDGGGWAKKK